MRRPPIVGVPCFTMCAAGPFRSDLLPEIPRAQRLDELGPDDDGGNHGQEAGDQDWDHAPAIFAISAGMPSSPTAREALTSTASPGRRKARRLRPRPRRRPPTRPARTARGLAHADDLDLELSGELADLPVIALGSVSPSSAISPSTATRRRAPARSARWTSAARIESGLAL